MSLTGAEKLIDTGCGQADAHGAVHSFQADVFNKLLSSRRVRATRAAAIIPRCNHSFVYALSESAGLKRIH
jgi:hypothetical protein